MTIIVGCVLSQLKPLELSILDFGLGLFSQLRMESSSGFILYLVQQSKGILPEL